MPRPEWMTDLPDSVDGEETLSRYKTLPDLATAFMEQRKTIAGMVKVPQKDATPADLKQFLARVAPEKPDAYEVPDSPRKPLYEKLRVVAHEGAVTAPAWKMIVGEIEKEREAADAESKKSRDEVVAGWQEQLKKEYGNNADKVQAQAHRVLEAMKAKDPTLGAFLEKTNIHVNPSFLGVLAKVGSLTSSDTTPAPGTDASTIDRHGIVKRLGEISADPAWKSGMGPDKRRLNTEFEKLIGQLVDAGYSQGLADPQLMEDLRNA